MKTFLNFLKILHCELHQWSPLDFNLILNCLDSYIAPKLKQRRWRPQQFVCPETMWSTQEASAHSNASGARVRVFFFSRWILLPTTFSIQVNSGLISIYVQLRLTFVYRLLVAICIIEFKKVFAKQLT